MISSKERLQQRLLRWYRRALSLYPHTYREEYAVEMRTVFEMRLVELSGAPGWNLIKFSLRELRDLPFGLLAAYQSERNRLKMKNSLERWFVQEPGSFPEVLLAIIPFFLTAFVTGFLSLIPAVDQFPMWAGILILLALAFVQVILGVIGLLVHLPRWSLPYAGILVVLASFSALLYLNNMGIVPLPEEVSPLAVSAFLAVYLVVLFLLLGLIAWAAGKFKLTRSLADRVKIDKTLLPFMMYGGSLVFVAVSYEDTAEGGLYMMLSALAMIFGAWAYLRLENVRGQMTALSAGSSIAIFFALIANVILIDYPSLVISIGGLQIKSIVIYTLITWLVTQVMIFMPLLIGGRANRSTENSQPAAV